MKDRIVTNSIRNIFRSFPRFISLLVMSALGVFTFAGLHAAAPDMITTLDNYLDSRNVYDMYVISDMGLTDEDVDAIEALDQVEKAEASNTEDVIALTGVNEHVITVHQVPEDINEITLLEGSMPEKNNEIIVEESLLTKENLSIGDKIVFRGDGFTADEAVITGTVSSPLHYNNVKIEQKRGNTGVGAGTITYFSYMTKDAFDRDVFSVVYITAKGAKDLETGSGEYETKINSLTDELESIKEEREKARSDGLVEDEFAKIPGTDYMSDTQKQAVKDDIKKEIDEPTWFISDRTDYPTYDEYMDDVVSIGNLSRVFPFIFFLVAILISLISMNRMVEDDRTEIGTLKSLGFSSGKIITKYVMFALAATIIGAVGGAVAGLIIMPNLIFGIYKILFSVPDFALSPRWGTTLLGIGITIFCVAGTSILTAVMVLRERPASLMRPKPPRSGKRILLERIGPLWEKMNFSTKITMRNLFRYKKRGLVTIGGIAGCTALILIGFGMKDSIVDIPNIQFGEIFEVDGMAYVNTEGDPDKAREFIDSKSDVTKSVSTQRLNAEVSDTDVLFMVTEDQNELGKIVNLMDSSTGEEVSLEPGKVVITEKLSIIKDLHEGDTIEITDINNKQYSYQISEVVRNHFDHIIFLDADTFGKFSEFEPNLIYFSTDLENDEDREKLSSELLKSEDVLNVLYKDTLTENADHMLKSLDGVVVILIVLAAMLSFVVLYNLSNININERKRELATLKVLGFYDIEVDAYIMWETTILTAVGIAGGLVMGYFLVDVVVGTIEIDKARFMYTVKPQSFLYAILVSGGFAFIVTFITHFVLKRINMIESLKSVE